MFKFKKKNIYYLNFNTYDNTCGGNRMEFFRQFKYCKKMISSAKRAGADVVKFQIWNPKFLKKGPWDEDGRRKIYEKAFLDQKNI